MGFLGSTAALTLVCPWQGHKVKRAGSFPGQYPGDDDHYGQEDDRLAQTRSAPKDAAVGAGPLMMWLDKGERRDSIHGLQF